MKKSIFKSVISTICAIFCGIFTFCLLNGEIDITTIIGSVGFLVVSICATIVQAHNGTITACNHEHGAEFSFSLPKEDTIS